MKNKTTHTPRGAAKPGSFFKVNAQADARTEVLLYGDIGDYWGGIRASDFIAAIKPHKDEEIDLRINTYGGSVWEGTTIANYLRGLNVNCIVDGVVASIGTRIALACKKVSMPPSAFFVIHNSWDAVIGNKEALRKHADDMAKVDDTLLAEYCKKSGCDEEEMRGFMAAETYYSGTEAVELGLADELLAEIAEETVQAKIQSLSFSRFAPHARIEEPRGKTPPPNQTQTPPAPPAQPKTMEKLLAALAEAKLIPSAKLDDDNAAALFKSEFAKLADRIKDLDKEKADLQAKLDEQAKTHAQAAADASVAEAVKDGKIKDDKDLRARWAEAYVKDPVGTKAMLAGMETAKKPRGAAPLPDNGEGDDMTLEDVQAAMSKETDPLKKHALGLKARELRGHKGLFAPAS